MNRDFIPRIEAVRGVAALTEATFHFGTLAVIMGEPSNFAAYKSGGVEAIAFRIYMAFSNGFGAVVAFFVISGFVLARSLDRRMDLGGDWLLDFLRARVFRLFPAAIAAIALFTLLYYQFGANYYGASFAPIDGLLNMLFIETDIDRVMWSMKVECVAIPLIIGAALILRKFDVRPLLGILGLLVGLSFVTAYVRVLGPGPNLAPLYAFAVGVLIHFRGAAVAALIKPMWVTPSALFWILVFCVCGALQTTGWTILLECISAASLVLLIVHHPQSPVFKPLDWAVARFYGRISYSFYLLHPLMMWLATLVAAPLQQAQAAGLPLIVLTIAMASASVLLTTPLAYVFWRFVETPGIELGRIGQRRTVDMAVGR